MTLDENMKGDIRGRAISKEVADAFIKRLNTNHARFANVNADRGKENTNPETKEYPYSFTVTFTYLPG